MPSGDVDEQLALSTSDSKDGVRVTMNLYRSDGGTEPREIDESAAYNPL